MITMRRNDGKYAENLIRKSLKIWTATNGGVVLRMADTNAIRGKNPAVVAVEEQPSDFVVIRKGGIATFVEVKSTINLSRYTFSYIKEHQWASANLMTSLGADYYFALICKKPYGSECYWIKSDVLYSLFRFKGTSIKWCDLEKYKVTRIKGSFDISL